MKLSTPLLSLLVNFLLGASWAFAFVGATITFSLYSELGIIYALIASLLGLIPGLFMVLLLEYFFIKQEQLNELKKQTKLLEKLTEK